jgi:hypothetical protein
MEFTPTAEREATCIVSKSALIGFLIATSSTMDNIDVGVDGVIRIRRPQYTMNSTVPWISMSDDKGIAIRLE